MNFVPSYKVKISQCLNVTVAKLMVWIQYYIKPGLCEHISHSYEILQHSLPGPLYGPSSLLPVTLAFFLLQDHVQQEPTMSLFLSCFSCDLFPLLNQVCSDETFSDHTIYKTTTHIFYLLTLPSFSFVAFHNL